MTSAQWRRWMVRLGPAVVALPLLFGLALWLIDPQGVTMLARRLIHPPVANAKPPAMFADEVDGAQGSPQEISRRLTARLQHDFPLGTKEETLRSTLLAQGFRPLPPPPLNCVQPVEHGKARPAEPGLKICPPQDQRKSLQYQWRVQACSSTITVRWSIDASDTVTLLDGHYHAVCT